jgi:hypothetical protein
MTQEQLCTYNVPLSFIDSYPDHPLIVRATDPVAVVQHVSAQHLNRLVALQLLDISADLEELDGWNPGLPIEVVLADPEVETMKLYRLCRLQRSHPVRVAVPIVPGFSKAVRVASFLQLPVKLEGAQPDEDLVAELSEALDFFLHNKAVSQPIEYFSGLLTTVIHKQPVTLWDIQEEHPSIVRYVDERGVETLARRPFTPENEDLNSFQFELTKRVLSPESECSSCEFFLNCGGYFKWPDREFSCAEIKRVFRRLRDAAFELHDDLSLYPAAHTESAT